MKLLYALLLTMSAISLAHASAYEAPLPPQLSTDPDMCRYAPCGDVIAADSFSIRKGRPPYVEAYRSGELVGYVFLSTDIVDIPAYSGKPVVTLIGMDTKGIITGVKILRHSEPILLVGIPESELVEFIKQYVGKFAGDKVEIGTARRSEGYIGVDAISGATVTVIAENQVIMRCAVEVAKQVGILEPVIRPQARFLPLDGTRDWNTLLREGSVRRLTVTHEEVGEEESGNPYYIDIYFGYLNAPVIGRSILGERGYRRLMENLGPSDHAIFIIARGDASFKGSGFVRGGIYDRIQVLQDMEIVTFRDTDYLPLYDIKAPGAPGYRESGIFIIRSGSFSAAYPWKLVFLANRQDRQTKDVKTFINFDREYWIPGAYLEGGRPEYRRPDPTWLAVWKSRRGEIALFILLLAAMTIFYLLRDRWVRRASYQDKRWISIPRYFFWISSLGFVGYYAMAQPSITHVMTWFHSLIYGWRWELFLTDPIIFIFWWFIIITLLLWGRGLFCGWLCPYGALHELTFKVAGALGLRRYQFALPAKWHNRLKWLKYLIFLGLLAISFHSMGLAERLAEVEPFKTTFLTGVWSRSWPFILYWLALFGLAMLMERPFCKYLCPLGAGLAIPSTFRLFPLRRKQECRTCHACANDCGAQAIDPRGRIDQRECMLCQSCMILYYDDHACPPLSRERKRRARANLPLTEIGADGYFVPINKIK